MSVQHPPHTVSGAAAGGETSATVSIRSALIDALEKKDFKWRTVDGLAKELAASPGNIMTELQALIDEGVVIRSTVPTKKGEELFTTRRHYSEFASPAERLVAAFRNRAS